MPPQKIKQDISEDELNRRRINNRLNDIRLGPLKQIPINLFMMWVVGNEVSIFSIMFVGMAVINPLQSIFNAGKNFTDFEDDALVDHQIRTSVNQSKWIFIGCSFLCLLVALVKLSWMELLPVSVMDWLPNTPPTYKEHSAGIFLRD
ncbi:unnamed protein product [Phytomonas sp. Hart1]|nr:unnamed protein product [Phytomonas sp. Hart1]|eukprot:CCW68053.1 unnamed protein product [Phytomonas sp. isolate Hart1]